VASAGQQHAVEVHRKAAKAAAAGSDPAITNPATTNHCYRCHCGVAVVQKRIISSIPVTKTSHHKVGGVRRQVHGSRSIRPPRPRVMPVQSQSIYKDPSLSPYKPYRLSHLSIHPNFISSIICIVVYSTKSWSDSCSHNDIDCHCCGRVSIADSQLPNVPEGPADLRPHICTPDLSSSLSQTELVWTFCFPPLTFFISSTVIPGRWANDFRFFPLLVWSCAATFKWLFSAHALLAWPSGVSSNFVTCEATTDIPVS